MTWRSTFFKSLPKTRFFAGICFPHREDVPCLDVLVGDIGKLRQVPQQTPFQGLMAMNRNRKPDGAAGLAVDMMASVDAKQGPTATLDHASEVPAGYRLHAGNSSIRSVPPGSGGATSMDRHPSIASWRFCISSSMLSACVAQPGIAGTSAQKPPSSASCTTILIFMFPSPSATFARARGKFKTLLTLERRQPYSAACALTSADTC